MFMLTTRYCDNCGWIKAYESYEHRECPVCGNKMTDSSLDWVAFAHMTDEEADNYVKLLLNGKEIPHDLVVKRVEYRANRKAAIRSGRPFDEYTPKCPTCGSTNVRPISATKRVASAFSFGLFGKSATKQYECLNCNYKW